MMQQYLSTVTIEPARSMYMHFNLSHPQHFLNYFSDIVESICVVYGFASQRSGLQCGVLVIMPLNQ